MAVGLIGGISDGLPSIMQLFSGYCSDRLGRRKPLVVAGYGLSAIAKLLLAFSTTWQQVLVRKALERGGKGVRTAPRDAMISESADKGSRGRGFGLHRAMDSSGAVLGSLLAYALWQGGMGYSSIFLVAGIMAIFALLPFHRVKESFRAPNCHLKLSLSDLSPDLRKFLVIASLFALGNFSYMFFILRSQELFSGAQAIAMPLLLYVLFNLVYAVMSMPIGIWSDRIGRKNVLVLGYAVFAMTCLGFAFVSSMPGLIVLFALYGLVYALVDGSQSAFVSDLSRSSIRSTSLGLYYAATGSCSILSGLVAGWLWASLGAQATFIFGVLAAAMAAVALTLMKKPGESA
ncbi:Multidrug resistance protein MdtH [uncultured archaeon]|nr:Multidrug resistance protein MdtH [uncultured archaeon]